MTTEKEVSTNLNDSAAITSTNKTPLSEDVDSTKVLDDDDDYIEPRMTKAKWLACIALGISYTTAFQQGATLGAIVKSIDEALGKFLMSDTDLAF
jgi:hypothetical protein